MYRYTGSTGYYNKLRKKGGSFIEVSAALNVKLLQVQLKATFRELPVQ